MTTRRPIRLHGDTDRTTLTPLRVDVQPGLPWNRNTCQNGPSRGRGVNVRRLADTVRSRAGGLCQTCGVAGGDDYPYVPGLDTDTAVVGVHEQYSYNPATLTATLVRLVAMCQRCHDVAHMGETELAGNAPQALTWYGEVVNAGPASVRAQVAAAKTLTEQVAAFTWTIDSRLVTQL